MALPADLAHWLVPLAGPNPSAIDVSWDRANSQVWHVAAGAGDDIYVKISSSSAAHAAKSMPTSTQRRYSDAGKLPLWWTAIQSWAPS